MGSKEEFTGVQTPWTEEQKALIRTTFEQQLGNLERIRKQREAQATRNPGVAYLQLVSKENLAKRVWYRGYPGGQSHEFVLVLTNPDKEVLSKVYRTEVDLQGQFPFANFDFDLRFSPLSRKQRADLGKSGYKQVLPEETALPNSL